MINKRFEISIEKIIDNMSASKKYNNYLDKEEIVYKTRFDGYVRTVGVHANKDQFTLVLRHYGNIIITVSKDTIWFEIGSIKFSHPSTPEYHDMLEEKLVDIFMVTLTERD